MPKGCPRCAATRVADASRCGCGYLFGPHASDNRQYTLGPVADYEKLYEEYLAARVAHAVKTANTEAAEQSVESWSTKLAAQATKAVTSVAPQATRQQVRLAVATIRAAPRALPTTQAATITKAEAAPPVTDRYVTPSKKPGATFRATQAAKAAKALQATLARETVECQRCTAIGAAGAVHCRCGYPLQSPKYEAPVLVLRKNKRAALAKDEDLLTAIYTAADTPKAD